MKAWLLLAAAMTAASAPALANMPAEMASDPLMKQILAKQITQVNGGITAAVLVQGSKNGIDLNVSGSESPEETAPAAAEELAEKPAKRSAKKAPRRAASGAAAAQASRDVAAK